MEPQVSLEAVVCEEFFDAIECVSFDVIRPPNENTPCFPAFVTSGDVLFIL